jgi:hypothetical protein
VAYSGIVHRIAFDLGGLKYERTVYNQILWAEAGWPTGFFASVEAGNPAKEAKFRKDGIKHAGATITTLAALQARIASGATGATSSDTIVMAGLNPLFAGGAP